MVRGTKEGYNPTSGFENVYSIHPPTQFTPKKENRKEKIRDKNQTQREEYIFVKRLIICMGRGGAGSTKGGCYFLSKEVIAYTGGSKTGALQKHSTPYLEL